MLLTPRPCCHATLAPLSPTLDAIKVEVAQLSDGYQRKLMLDQIVGEQLSERTTASSATMKSLSHRPNHLSDTLHSSSLEVPVPPIMYERVIRKATKRTHRER